MALGEVDAQEREARVGHRVDHPLGQVGLLGLQLEVVAPERHDLRALVGAGHRGHAVGLEAGAGDQVAGRDDLVKGGLEQHPVVLAADAGDLVAGQDLAAELGDVVGVVPGDLAPVDDAGLGREDALDAGAVRLDLADLLWADHPDAGDAVGGGAVPEVLEPRQLRLLDGDDQLAALLVADALLFAVGIPTSLHLQGVIIRTASSSICPLPLIANRIAARASSSASAIAINSRPPLVGTKYACFISAPMARNLSFARSTLSTIPCCWMVRNASAVKLASN